MMDRRTYDSQGPMAFIIAHHHGAEVWVELTAANFFAILKALADGKGRLVVRFWGSFPTAWAHKKGRWEWQRRYGRR